METNRTLVTGIAKHLLPTYPYTQTVCIKNVDTVYDGRAERINCIRIYP